MIQRQSVGIISESAASNFRIIVQPNKPATIEIPLAAVHQPKTKRITVLVTIEDVETTNVT